MLRNACKTRASSPGTNVFVFGSIPRMPATNTKSPARVPRFHVPVGLIAPAGASVLTPAGESDCADTTVAAQHAAPIKVALRNPHFIVASCFGGKTTVIRNDTVFHR